MWRTSPAPWKLSSDSNRKKGFDPENLTVHTLAIKHSSRLKARLEEYPLPDGAAVEEMVRLGAEAAREMGMQPYYMYRQKYMQGNLENVGYAKPGTEAGARVERLPSPKDVPSWYGKQEKLFAEKKRLFSD